MPTYDEETGTYDSPWLNTLMDIFADGGDWEDLTPMLFEIDEILKTVWLLTDSIGLQKRIRKLIKNDND